MGLDQRSIFLHYILRILLNINRGPRLLNLQFTNEHFSRNSVAFIILKGDWNLQRLEISTLEKIDSSVLKQLSNDQVMFYFTDT